MLTKLYTSDQWKNKKHANRVSHYYYDKTQKSSERDEGSQRNRTETGPISLYSACVHQTVALYMKWTISNFAGLVWYVFILLSIYPKFAIYSIL